MSREGAAADAVAILECTLGLDEIHFHDLKHVARGNLERAQVSRSIGKQILGNRSDAAFDRYFDSRLEDQRRALAKVDRLRKREQAKLGRSASRLRIAKATA